ncbi:hypothetical protein H4S14_000817 [Agrobacterium vitis]|nr:hypothetical protein [Agrobacterium vitis]MBE1437090.1 hypothetical protein [Agrobacterium vitis]
MKIAILKNQNVQDSFIVPENAAVSDGGLFVKWDDILIPSPEGQTYIISDAPIGSIIGDDGTWTLPTVAQVSVLDDVKAGKVAALTTFCADKIVSGYVSSALGSPHTYPSKLNDQINMMGSVSASLLPNIAMDWSTPFWCADLDGVWAFRQHSCAQIQRAGADGKAHVVSCQSALEQLTVLVMSATTAETVDAINWPLI